MAVVLRVLVWLAVMGLVVCRPGAVCRGRRCLLRRRLGELLGRIQPDGKGVGLNHQLSIHRVCRVFGRRVLGDMGYLREVLQQLFLARVQGLVLFGAVCCLLGPVELLVEGPEVDARHPYCS